MCKIEHLILKPLMLVGPLIYRALAHQNISINYCNYVSRIELTESGGFVGISLFLKN
jgi:hypothetical protein